MVIPILKQIIITIQPGPLRVINPCASRWYHPSQAPSYCANCPAILFWNRDSLYKRSSAHGAATCFLTAFCSASAVCCNTALCTIILELLISLLNYFKILQTSIVISCCIIYCIVYRKISAYKCVKMPK